MAGTFRYQIGADYTTGNGDVSLVGPIPISTLAVGNIQFGNVDPLLPTQIVLGYNFPIVYVPGLTEAVVLPSPLTTSSGGYRFDYSDGSGTASMVGGSFGDILTGSSFDDTLDGAGGADVLVGGLGADSLRGGSGNDFLVGGAGADSIDGGTGTDVASYAGSSAAISVNLQSGLGTGGDAAGDRLSGIEILVTGNGADLILGSINAETVYGQAGADTVYGGNGDDLLLGEDGADLLFGENGSDTMLGGAANDIMFGGDGTDYMVGNDGNDTLLGGTGADRLQGDAGDDYLISGGGYDLLIGGTGLDVFEFSRADFAVGVWSTVLDLGKNSAEYEGIVIRGAAAAGDIAFAQDGANALIYATGLGLNGGIIVQNITVADLQGHLGLF